VEPESLLTASIRYLVLVGQTSYTSRATAAFGAPVRQARSLRPTHVCCVGIAGTTAPSDARLPHSHGGVGPLSRATATRSAMRSGSNCSAARGATYPPRRTTRAHDDDQGQRPRPHRGRGRGRGAAGHAAGPAAQARQPARHRRARLPVGQPHPLRAQPRRLPPRRPRARLSEHRGPAGGARPGYRAVTRHRTRPLQPQRRGPPLPADGQVPRRRSRSRRRRSGRACPRGTRAQSRPDRRPGRGRGRTRPARLRRGR